MTIWFAADTHFGHAAIIGHRGRPFASAEEMDEALIRSWNAVVRPRDVVWQLGDFASGSQDTASRYFSRLNRCKYLARGNHDETGSLSCAWESVHDLGPH